MAVRAKARMLELPALDAEIERLSLREHLREIDDQGLSVVPPERTGFDQDWLQPAPGGIFAPPTVKRSAGGS